MASDVIVKMIKIPVTDVEVSAKFYVEVLGLDEEFVVADYGWAQLHAGNLPIALYEEGKGGGTAKAGSTDHMQFAVSDFDALKQSLTVHDIDPDKHFHTGADGTKFYLFNDPDGNTIQVMQK